MSRYIVFERRDAGSAPTSEARFVRDAFSKWAVFFPYLWLLRQGLWLSALLCFVLFAGFGIVAERSGLPLAGLLLPILLGCLVALEGPSLRAAKLRRKGFEDRAVVEAIDEEEAAILYYAGTEAASVTRETWTRPPFVGRESGAVTNLLDLPRTLS